MKKKELWLQNPSLIDVNLSDVGVKVGANKTINVFAYNPYLTADKVRLSLQEGSIFKRLKSGVLKKVAGKPSDKEAPPLKVSTAPANIIRTKSSVLVDMHTEEILDADDLTGIADYGLGDLEEAVNVKSEFGAVVVEQKQDNPPPEKSDAKAELEVVKGHNVSGQSVMVMTKQVEAQSNPVGDLVPSASPEEPFYVVEAPKPAPEPKTEEKTAPPEVMKEAESVVVEAKTDKVKPKPKPDGMRVATKTSDGITVMTVKE